jgi:hypothetical protein
MEEDEEEEEEEEGYSYSYKYAHSRMAKMSRASSSLIRYSMKAGTFRSTARVRQAHHSIHRAATRGEKKKTEREREREREGKCSAMENPKIGWVPRDLMMWKRLWRASRLRASSASWKRVISFFRYPCSHVNTSAITTTAEKMHRNVIREIRRIPMIQNTNSKKSFS